MPETRPTQAKAFHGVQNGQWCLRTDDATVTEFPYLKSISLNTVIENAEQYANNKLILQVPKDDGYEGELGTTAPDSALETALGFVVAGATGKYKVNLISYKRVDLYYEVTMEYDEGPEVRKVWLYNVQIGKGSENANTDTNSLEFGEYTYPIRVYGIPLMDEGGTEEYVDEKGIGRTVFMAYADPEDADYDTFDQTVPIPEVAAEEVGGGGSET